MFEGFALERVEVSGAALRVRHGGEGPPLLLLHGHPRTHTTWHRVAPLLAPGRTVVCPDLRGYGRSSKPAAGERHENYSKRAMARDCIELMAALGHERFDLAGHDRGSYVAFRAAMDHPDAIRRLVLIDCVPIGEALARCDARFAQAWWHWFFLGQTRKPAEEWINRDPESWYALDPEAMGGENCADLRAAINDPETVRGMVEDYRAGLAIDRFHDEEDRAAGRRLGCPLLLAWSLRDDLEELYADPVAVWRDWADDVRGAPIDSGHHVAEENPEGLVAAIESFLSG